MFPIATFYFRHFVFYVTVIMVHTQLWTKQSNVKTNTKYTNYVNTSVAIYSNNLKKNKKNMTFKSTKNITK